LIILEPTGGLANRIRVIATAIHLKKQLNCRLMVIWNENYELNCPFNQLFEPIDEFVIIKKKRLYNYVSRSAQPTLKGRILAKLKNKLTGIDYCITDEDVVKIDIYQTLKDYKTSYIKTCQALNNSTTGYNLFKPIALIRQKITALTNGFSSNTVGIQIRRTDNSFSITNSPVELFIDKMHQLVSSTPDVSFFLATDDADVETDLKKLFGDSMISQPKELSRETVIGMQDAVTDFFALSKTNRILGSYWSSFSEVAAELGNTPLEILKTS
jgi:hypothetical protein